MGKTLSRLEVHGHISRERSASDRRSHVVSLTDQGREAVAAAADMERSVLSAAPIDPDVLRQELQAVVRVLANRSASPEVKAIVTGADPGLAAGAISPAGPGAAAQATPLN
jgi:DNA-binding MarR family transcriptional regulator